MIGEVDSAKKAGPRNYFNRSETTMKARIIPAIPGTTVNESDVERFLESNLNLQLATIEDGNYPNINQVWFYYDKVSGKIYANTDRTSRKVQNIQKNPDKVYFSIDDENFSTEGLKGVKGRARAAIISEDRKKVIAVMELDWCGVSDG